MFSKYAGNIELSDTRLRDVRTEEGPHAVPGLARQELARNQVPAPLPRDTLSYPAQVIIIIIRKDLDVKELKLKSLGFVGVQSKEFSHGFLTKNASFIVIY